MSLSEHFCLNQKLDVTVWEADSDEGISFETVLKDYRLRGAHETLLYIAPPADNESQLLRLLKPGALVGAAMMGKGRPVLFYPIVESHHSEPKNPDKLLGIWLKVTEKTQFEVVQRRRHIRIGMRIPIKLVGLSDDGEPVEYHGVTMNVSGGGMRFVGPERIAQGAELLVFLRFRDEITIRKRSATELEQIPDELLKLPGTVVFSGRNAASLSVKEKFVMGIRFDNLSSREEALIVRECFRRELGIKRLQGDGRPSSPSE